MRIGSLVISWAIAVLLGSAVCALVAGNISIALIFVVISGLCSLPYLVLMILLTRKTKSFIVKQLIHLILALVTGVVIVLFENNFYQFGYVLLPYFMIGAGAQAFFHYRSPLSVQIKNEGLIDEEI